MVSLWLIPSAIGYRFFPGSIAKGSSSKSGCQLHLPTSHANLSRVTSPANFSCQLVESYFTCQLLMPTCRELLHLPTSHVNSLRVTSPANFSCQLFGCYLILLKAQANLSGVTSLSKKHKLTFLFYLHISTLNSSSFYGGGRPDGSLRNAPLCGDRACRSALAVAPCEFVLSPMNPLRGSCVSKRSRCGAVRICLERGEPSAGIVRVEALSLWRRANLS